MWVYWERMDSLSGLRFIVIWSVEMVHYSLGCFMIAVMILTWDEMSSLQVRE